MKLNIKNIYTSLEANSEKIITVKGWITNNRTGKKISFLKINDGSCFQGLQVVYKKEALSNYESIIQAHIYSAVCLEGVLKHTPNKQQSCEIVAQKIKIVSANQADYPIQKKNHSSAFLRQQAHFRGRTKLFRAIMRIRSQAAWAIHDYFHKNDFLFMHSPIITSGDAEGAGEAFDVVSATDNKKNSFFNKAAKLCVSGQLHAETYAQIFQKVYTFGPTFRADPSHTSKHVSEFWMVEPEVAFADLKDNMELISQLVKHVMQHVLKNCFEELTFLNNTENNLIHNIQSFLNMEYKTYSYKEVIKILQKAQQEGHVFQYSDIQFGIDLQKEHELYMCEIYEYAPCFIYDFPKSIKAFYMKINDDNETVRACDFFLPGIGEVAGGSQREEDYNLLIERCQALNINPEEINWYLELRKYSYVYSSGFGLGFGRLIMFLTGSTNIVDVIPYPRTPKSLLF